jgi:hypothetical protein
LECPAGINRNQWPECSGIRKKIGTTQSVIARIEDSDYKGHSLRMLRRVAEALDARLSVHLLPQEAVPGR